MTSNISTTLALTQAIEVAGSQSALARVCGVSQAAVWGWLKLKKALPAEHVLKVEDATGISRHSLRPDIYPVEPRVAPAQQHRFHGTDLHAAMAAE